MKKHFIQCKHVKFWSYYDRGADYCDGRVCLSLCSPGRDHIFGTTCPIFTIFMLVTYGRGSVLLRRRSDMLRISGFKDDVIFAHTGKLRLFDVAARLRRWGSHAALGYYRPQWTCWIFMTSCLYIMSLRVIATSKWRELIGLVAPGGNTEVYDCLDGCCKCMQSVILCVFAIETGISTGNESVLNVWANSTINLVF